ncbi:hypothetical protein Goarm_014596 [Gossypium armourianum]|uniref:Uncharacterized protein n=1 Tax=Gossypium armourianum TaxID=34283 RepID=A0A7J9J9D3_9ROSI|nr:hypothetical protein [Gossypium armourianum]
MFLLLLGVLLRRLVTSLRPPLSVY